MSKPSIIISPYPRTMAEIFDEATLMELTNTADVLWGRDEPLPEGQFVDALADASAVAVGEWRYQPGAIAHAGPSLKVVFEVLGTHDHPELDYETCFTRGIPVGSIAPVFGDVVAEMCLALALSASRSVAMSDRAFRAGKERYLHAGNVGSSSLLGKTVGFVGCGSISRSLGLLLDPFGVELLGFDPWLDTATLAARNIEAVELAELFERSAFVFVLAMPTPDNAEMIADEHMALLSPDDVLVLASRAHVIDFDSLTAHLLAGRFRAGIDVYPTEPLPPDHPIRTAPSAVLTAHIAGALPEALLEIGRMILEDFAAVITGRQPARMQYANPALIESLRRTQ